MEGGGVVAVGGDFLPSQYDVRCIYKNYIPPPSLGSQSLSLSLIHTPSPLRSIPIPIPIPISDIPGRNAAERIDCLKKKGGESFWGWGCCGAGAKEGMKASGAPGHRGGGLRGREGVGMGVGWDVSNDRRYATCG